MNKLERSELFNEACQKRALALGKPTLSLEEKRDVSRELLLSRVQAINEALEQETTPRIINKIRVITAFSDNYQTGKLCSEVNQQYCIHRQYEYVVHRMPEQEMYNIIYPRTHLTWYKVKMICDQLSNMMTSQSSSNLKKIEIDNHNNIDDNFNHLSMQEDDHHAYTQSSHNQKTSSSSSSSSSSSHINYSTHSTVNITTNITNKNDCIYEQYLLWIDSDAIFINFNQTIESYIQRGKYKNIIIAEDMTPCCLINAGVLLLKVNAWNIELWNQVWNCYQYYNKPFYDQSALLKILKQYQEGLHLISPFHSYVPGGPTYDQYFPNITVFPHIDFNTNIGYSIENQKVRRKFNRSHEKMKLRQMKYNINSYHTLNKNKNTDQQIVTSDSCSSSSASGIMSDDDASTKRLHLNMMMGTNADQFIEQNDANNMNTRNNTLIDTTDNKYNYDDYNSSHSSYVNIEKLDTKTLLLNNSSLDHNDDIHKGDICHIHSSTWPTTTIESRQIKLIPSNQSNQSENSSLCHNIDTTDPEHRAAQFIYHAAGRCDKFNTLTKMIQQYLPHIVIYTSSHNNSHIS